jgi:predicted AlkP superfamily phosphohydrolase/phosphomutase
MLFTLATPAMAYIGPGAGFAFMSSFFVLIAAGFVTFFALLSWPARAIVLLFKRRAIRKKSKARRVIIVGFDGLDPILCNTFMEQGAMPNLKRLSQTGSYRTLKTTTPAISPVAWSTFSTGVNPGKHRIFDFFTRDPNNYLPVLSSASITTSTRDIKIGPVKIPIRKATASFLRKSVSVWTILGKNKIFSSILRVPITFPPEKFYGTCLSAMCAPDILGTQGTFAIFSTKEPSEKIDSTGTHVPIKLVGENFKTSITGPTVEKNGAREALSLPIRGTVHFKKDTVTLIIGQEVLELTKGEYSTWIPIRFKAGVRKKVRGIARFLLTGLKPDLSIYMTPINIDPERPDLPISHPGYYAICASKLHGPFSTLGLAEDTWALDEGVIDEKAFLDQAYDIYEERKALLLDNIRRGKEGLLAFVFDTSDRIQHMFFRYQSDDHPANKGKDTTVHKDTIEELYIKMDKLVGEVMDKINDKDLVMFISDHGFKSFKYGVNLNSWLWKEGYLTLKSGAGLDGEWFANVDWKKTRAYAYGLAGIFINTKGRERDGIVEVGNEKNAFMAELKEKLEKLEYNGNGKKPIRRVIAARSALTGPYVNDAPDLFIGYEEDYRASFNCAKGVVTEHVIEPNTRCWSGDHCVDPDLVPGVFFSNWKMKESAPSLQDLAPTILDIFGIEKSKFHDGEALSFYKPEERPAN